MMRSRLTSFSAGVFASALQLTPGGMLSLLDRMVGSHSTLCAHAPCQVSAHPESAIVHGIHLQGSALSHA